MDTGKYIAIISVDTDYNNFTIVRNVITVVKTKILADNCYNNVSGYWLNYNNNIYDYFN